MKLEKYYFFIRFIIFYYQFNLIMTLVGPNVRLAQPNEFPFVVSIMRLNGTNQTQIQNYHRCTGTLISKQDVLTADHCLATTFREGFKVMVGSRDLARGTSFFPLFIWTFEHWILYKRRDLDGERHDIAFIKLCENVPSRIDIAPTGNIENNLLYGLTLTTAGWGQTNNQTKPRILNMGRVKVLTKIECELLLTSYERRIIILDFLRICTVGNPYVLLGHGDSGGPLLYFGTVIGINTAITPALTGGYYPHQINIHLNLRPYQEFLEDMLTTFYMNL